MMCRRDTHASETCKHSGSLHASMACMQTSAWVQSGRACERRACDRLPYAAGCLMRPVALCGRLPYAASCLIRPAMMQTCMQTTRNAMRQRSSLPVRLRSVSLRDGKMGETTYNGRAYVGGVPRGSGGSWWDLMGSGGIKVVGSRAHLCTHEGMHASRPQQQQIGGPQPSGRHLPT